MMRNPTGPFAMRFSITLTAKQNGKTVSGQIFLDLIGFVYGQAEVGLDVVTDATQPSYVDEQRLTGLLVARAKAALG